MQSLLRWGIENSANDDSTSGVAPLTQRTDLDPGIIDAILGRPDSELMKDALAKAQDASLDEDARLTALDDLEMVKQFLAILYPNNSFFCFAIWIFLTTHPGIRAHRAHLSSSSRISTMRMVSESVDEGFDGMTLMILSIDLEKLGMWEPLQGLLASPSDDVKTQALWVIGTAVQNNPTAQKAVRQSGQTVSLFGC